MTWLAIIVAACMVTKTELDEPRIPPQPAALDLPTVADHASIPGCEPAAAVYLNEVSPANVETLSDVEGESVDWLELYNADTSAVGLAGWTLSDDPDAPTKWTFPAVTLEPGSFLVVYPSGKSRAQIVGSWETRIDQGHEWRYLAVDSAPDGTWREPGYDDSGWEEGPSGFGKGDDDDATRVGANTVYIRTALELTAAELADLSSLVLHVDYDDGFAAYLNGVEVARVALGLPGGAPPAWDALAAYSNGARMPEGGRPQHFDLDGSLGLLHEGANTLALEVHNAAVDSSDLSLVPFLTLGFASSRGQGAAGVLGLPLIDLHTSFSLRSSGEAVRLFDPGGCEADELDPIPLRADESYGRQPDGTGALGYFVEPTPGGPNVTESRPGFASPPEFAPSAGYYAGGTVVSVSSEPGAVVRYAWEGWEPTESSPMYQHPLQTGAEGEAVVLRARAWKEGLWPSRIATATYLLEPPSDLPIVSVVTDPPNLWDDEIGIYAFGPGARPEYPWYGANFYKDWKRSAHVEEWEPDGTLGFAVDGSVAIHGGTSRRRPQKNLEIDVGGGWSDEDAIEHEVFPGLGITTFPRLVLRAGGGDWLGCYSEGCMEGTMARDPLMNALTVGTDLDRMASRPARAYLNGAYWGLYFINEKADLAYVESHHGKDDIDLLKNEAIPSQGDNLSYLELFGWLHDHDLADPTSYAHARTLIDIDELQTYWIFEIFYANTDWPGNNIKFWRPRAADGRWRWLMFGTENGLGSSPKSTSDHDSLAAALAPDGDDWPNPPWSTELFRLLLQSPEFTRTFVNRYADYLNTLLLPGRTQGMRQELTRTFESEIPRQIERWGTWTDGVTTHALVWDEWVREGERIDRWLAERPTYAREHILSTFGLAGTWTLTLEADPPGGGTFELSAVTVEAPFSGTYFQGVPVTITAHPAPGLAFAGWSDPSLTGGATVTVAPTEPLTLIARFQ